MAKKTDTVTTADLSPYKPVGFDSLNLEDLHPIADFYGVEKADTVVEQVANFANDGVTYAQYAKQFKVPLPDDYVDEDAILENLDEVEEDTLVDTTPVTVPREQVLQDKTYLIRMTRKNPYFEVSALDGSRKLYRFTTDHPYAVMDRATASYVLQKEEGFRQAFPDELEEYYSE